VDGVGTSEEVFSRLLAGLRPRISADRITQLAGVSEPVPTAPADAGPRHSRSPASHSSVRCGRVRCAGCFTPAVSGMGLCVSDQARSQDGAMTSSVEPRRIEVKDGDQTVAAAEVTTVEHAEGTVRTSLLPSSGHTPPGSWASLVDAVMDLPEVQAGSRLEATVPLGDAESLERLRGADRGHRHAPGRVDRPGRCGHTARQPPGTRPGARRPVIHPVIPPLW
jgi:hypothetical protein